MFLDSVRRVAQPHQLQIVASPHASLAHHEHKSDMMNPVVAKLEKAAISHHASRSPSISNTFPGPPTAAAPASSPAPSGNFTPIPYNPAAPAAPEPIAHREKTPPPPDAGEGTGLATAAMNDQHAQQYSNPLQASFAPQSTSGPYIPGPPSRTNTFSGPPTPGIQRTNSGQLPPPPQSPPAFAGPPSAPPPVQQYANYPGSPGHPPVQSPGFPNHTPLPSPGYAPQQQYQPLTSPPPGGFTQYQYGSTGQATSGAVDPYGQVQYQSQQNPQLYRPTEQEATIDGNEVQPQRNSNMGKRAEKMEKGVGRFLKKLDKKF